MKDANMAGSLFTSPNFGTSTSGSIAEQVETKANAEIEDKKVALRQLVGDSYRCGPCAVCATFLRLCCVLVHRT